MSDKTRGYLGWNVPAAVAAVAASVWGVVGVAPTTSSRNSDTVQVGAGDLPTHDGLASFPTRIWQDPFAHRDAAREELRSTARKSQTESEQANSQGDSNLKGNKESKTANYKDIFSTILCDPNNRLLIMPVSVLGEDSEFESKDRTQYRHAVENALANNQFFLEFPDRMSFAQARGVTIHRGGKPVVYDPAVPVKLYSCSQRNASKGTDYVVVLWVDRRLGGERPLSVLKQLIDKIIFYPADLAQARMLGEEGKKARLSRKQVAISIVGPNFSDDLEDMALEARVEADKDKSEIQQWASTWMGGCVSIESPAATNYGAKDQPKRDLARIDIELHRKIGRDCELVSALRQELSMRWLANQDAIHFVEQGMSSPAGLSSSFGNADEGCAESTANNSSSDESYLGKMIRDTFGATSRTTVIPVLHQIADGGRRSASEDVTDYFARTLQELVSGRVSGGHEKFKIVGVFANSVDDKLAIMRAAKPLFPNATFVTTDLHAAYLEPQNLSFTRNMLVASHYGLIPHPPTQNKELENISLKFRDSYQVAVYHAVEAALLRLDPDFYPDSAADSKHQAQVYEIGQSHEVAYQGASERTVVGGPWNFVRRLGFACSIMLLGTLLLSQFAPFARPVWNTFFRGVVFQKKTSVLQSVAPEISISVLVTLVFCLRESHFLQFWCVAVLGGTLCFAAFLMPSRIAQVALSLFLIVMLLFWWGELLIPRESTDWLNGTSIWPSFMLMLFLCGCAALQVRKLSRNRRFPWFLTNQRYANCILPLIGPKTEYAVQGRVRKFRTEELLEFCWTELGLSQNKFQKSFENQRGWATRWIDIFPWMSANFPRLRNGEVAIHHFLTTIVYMLTRRTTRAVRCLSGSILLFIALGALYLGVPLAPPPARGDFAILISYFVHGLATFLVFWLVSYLLMQTLVLRRFLAIIQREIYIPEDTDDDLLTVERAHQLVDWTEAASWNSTKGLMVPSVLILLYAVARLPIWDGWHLNSVVTTILLLPLALTIGASILLRVDAGRLRERVLELLNHKRQYLRRSMIELAPEPKKGATAAAKKAHEKKIAEQKERSSELCDYISSVTDQIRSLSRGAFRDIWHDPILGSFLLFVTTLLTGPGHEAVGLLSQLAGIML